MTLKVKAHCSSVFLDSAAPRWATFWFKTMVFLAAITVLGLHALLFFYVIL